MSKNSQTNSLSNRERIDKLVAKYVRYVKANHQPVKIIIKETGDYKGIRKQGTELVITINYNTDVISVCWYKDGLFHKPDDYARFELTDFTFEALLMYGHATSSRLVGQYYFNGTMTYLYGGTHEIKRVNKELAALRNINYLFYEEID